MTTTVGPGACLVVAAQSCACAVPIAHVIETMRPLPVAAVPGMPTFVRGISVVRGAPMPVVDLGAILGSTTRAGVSAFSRFVSLRLGERRLALAVDAVVGIRTLDVGSIDRMPSLFRETSDSLLESVGILDEQLLLLLHTIRLLPEELWQRLEAPEEHP